MDDLFGRPRRRSRSGPRQGITFNRHQRSRRCDKGRVYDGTKSVEKPPAKARNRKCLAAPCHAKPDRPARQTVVNRITSRTVRGIETECTSRCWMDRQTSRIGSLCSHRGACDIEESGRGPLLKKSISFSVRPRRGFSSPLPRASRCFAPRALGGRQAGQTVAWPPYGQLFQRAFVEKDRQIAWKSTR